jgi:hypothetical protein
MPKGKFDIEIVQHEKEKKKLLELQKIEKIKLNNLKIMQEARLNDYKRDKKQSIGEMHRTIKLYKYEKVKIFNFRLIKFVTNLLSKEKSILIKIKLLLTIFFYKSILNYNTLN